MDAKSETRRMMQRIKYSLHFFFFLLFSCFSDRWNERTYNGLQLQDFSSLNFLKNKEEKKEAKPFLFFFCSVLRILLFLLLLLCIFYPFYVWTSFRVAFGNVHTHTHTEIKSLNIFFLFTKFSFIVTLKNFQS